MSLIWKYLQSLHWWKCFLNFIKQSFPSLWTHHGAYSFLPLTDLQNSNSVLLSSFPFSKDKMVSLYSPPRCSSRALQDHRLSVLPVLPLSRVHISASWSCLLATGPVFSHRLAIPPSLSPAHPHYMYQFFYPLPVWRDSDAKFWPPITSTMTQLNKRKKKGSAGMSPPASSPLHLEASSFA